MMEVLWSLLEFFSSTEDFEESELKLDDSRYAAKF
jgi:hypothetical protein